MPRTIAGMNAFWWHPFFADAVRWWALVVLLGWLAWPLAYRAGSLLPDRGLLLSKLLGLTGAGFVAAWLSFLGWSGADALRLALGLTGAVGFALFLLARSAMTGFVRRNAWGILGAEAAFLFAFVFYLWMRSYFADATYDARGWWGAEKWVNLGLLTSLWRDFSVPPMDPWLAGRPVNYYYFSHVVWAATARLAGVGPGVAFNLGLATVFGLLLQVSFAAGWAVARRLAGGWWAVFLVALAGPPAAWFQAAAVWRGGAGAFDFWAPSDVVADTRNEFPAFNWLLGDLHAHGMGLLLLLAAVCLLAQLGRAREHEACGWRRVAWREPSAWVLVLLLSAMWMTNGWDVAVLGVLGTVWVVAASARESASRGAFAAQAVQGILLGCLAAVAAVSVLSYFYSRLTHAPLILHSEMLGGLPGPLAMLGGVGWVDSAQRTRPAEWLAFWGLFAAGGLAVWRLRQPVQARRKRRGGGWNSPWVATFLWAAALGAVVLHGGGGFPWVGVGLVGLAAWALGRLRRWGGDEAVWWAMVLTAAGAVALAGAEFLYVDDPIEAPYDRYNTVFKIWYGVWGLAALALAAGLGGERAVRSADAGEAVAAFDALGGIEGDAASADSPEEGDRGVGRRVLFGVLCAFILVAGGLYPVLGAASRVMAGRARLGQWVDFGIDPWRARVACRTLDGTAFLDLPDKSPDDLALGRWMLRHLHGGGWLAEAAGESYSPAGRFSVLSGVPCVMGWGGHETQWRGLGFGDTVWVARKSVLDRVYGGLSVEEARRCCVEGGIRWIAVGKLERAAYDPVGLAKLPELGREVARFGDSALYEVSGADEASSVSLGMRRR